ncbi:mannose-1-phosphate guanylyltransferase/mannose-6-phosphate isomerase [Rheinheimera sp.]|uniref:mannose-1-phosphate guanylyltransferase/mannose-6-phosphate isomerase n=1 Tax=Rheinheimera sp. TaxID=1869214 RepID=UPI00307D842D
MDIMNSVFPVILSGGSGTRLWPLSRKHYPKQFLKLTSELTMLQETASRVTHLQPPILVCNDNHRFIASEQLQQIGVKPTATILEPIARNTAPAILLAAIKAQQLDKEAILVVLAADHVIHDNQRFRQAMNKALHEAQQGYLATFGVVPTKPEVGYGYIQARDISSGVSPIVRFVEKPNLATAEEYIRDGQYLWNSGMFVFKASVLLDEMTTLDPQLVSNVQLAFDAASTDLDFIRVDQELFAQCPDISIDYALMEKTQKGVVVALDAGWSDVGSFATLWDVMDKDCQGNVCLGDVKNIESRDCLVQSENQFIATVGVRDLVVIGTKDSILVAHKDKVQQVKDVVTYLANTDRNEHLLHREVHRPWGKYDSVDNGQRYQVKRITVKPGASLSKQMHHHRAEHWIVVSGTAVVEIDGKETLLSENQSIYIPLGAVHRLTNPGKVQLELIEVQSGSYLGEDDIVRFDDVYGRS